MNGIQLFIAKCLGKLRPVGAVVLKKGNAFLLVKKPRKENAWQFPQGGVEVQETFFEAAKRELKEECGDFSVEIFEPKIGSYSYFFPPEFSRHKKSILGAQVHFFRGNFLGGEISIDQNEIVAYRWCDSAEIKKLVSPEYWKVVSVFVSLG